ASVQPTASASRSCSTESEEPSASTPTEPSVACAVCTASSIAHSSCALTVCPRLLASTDCSSAVSTTSPEVSGTLLMQTRMFTMAGASPLACAPPPSSPDPLVVGVEQRSRVGRLDRYRVTLTEVLHRRLG